MSIATGSSNNIAVGDHAGSNLTTMSGHVPDSNNIDIGNPGVAGDLGTIRIGTSNQQFATYIQGISGNSISSGSYVYVNSDGKLGTFMSSRRYKEDIHDIAAASDNLYKLRPVAFRYKRAMDDGSKPLQYGLIAEEVDTVYPQLVIRNKDGQIEGVQYQQLPALLLNELQKQQKLIATQNEQLRNLLARLEALEVMASGKATTAAEK